MEDIARAAKRVTAQSARPAAHAAPASAGQQSSRRAHVVDERRFELAIAFRAGPAAETRSPVPPRAPVSTEVRELFVEAELDATLIAFLSAHSYAKPVTFGALVFHSVNELPALQHRYPYCLEQRLLVIGRCIDGNVIALDLQSGGVGFVDPELVVHEEAPVRQALRATPLELGSFFLAAALFEDPNQYERAELEQAFPGNAYEAGLLSATAWQALGAELAAFEGSLKEPPRAAPRARSPKLAERLRAPVPSADAWVLLTRGDLDGARTRLRELGSTQGPSALQALTVAVLEGEHARAAALVPSVDPAQFEAWAPLFEHWRARGHRELLASFAEPALLALLPRSTVRDLAAQLFDLGAYRDCGRALACLWEGPADVSDPDDAYDVACVECRRERMTSALAWLERALVLGFRDFALLAQDEDLARLRKLGPYHALLARYA